MEMVMTKNAEPLNETDASTSDVAGRLQSEARRQLNNRFIAAKAGIQHVRDNRTDVDALLADAAALIYRKFKALTDAGFSEDQAFQLVLAEVKARSGARL
jgi:hypothetical protein